MPLHWRNWQHQTKGSIMRREFGQWPPFKVKSTTKGNFSLKTHGKPWLCRTASSLSKLSPKLGSKNHFKILSLLDFKFKKLLEKKLSKFFQYHSTRGGWYPGLSAKWKPRVYPHERADAVQSVSRVEISTIGENAENGTQFNQFQDFKWIVGLIWV